MSAELDNYLAHYGVVGMKWGKRKGGGSSKTRGKNPRHENYGASQQRYDAAMYGNGHAKRVNNGMHDGKSLTEARSASYKVRNKRTVAKIALGVSTYALMAAGPSLKMGLDSAVLAKRHANGKKRTANLFADSNGIGSKPTVNLGYNPSTDRWE